MKKKNLLFTLLLFLIKTLKSREIKRKSWVELWISIDVSNIETYFNSLWKEVMWIEAYVQIKKENFMFKFSFLLISKSFDKLHRSVAETFLNFEFKSITNIRRSFVFSLTTHALRNILFSYCARSVIIELSLFCKTLKASLKHWKFVSTA